MKNLLQQFGFPLVNPAQIYLLRAHGFEDKVGILSLSSMPTPWISLFLFDKTLDKSSRQHLRRHHWWVCLYFYSSAHHKFHNQIKRIFIYLEKWIRIFFSWYVLSGWEGKKNRLFLSEDVDIPCITTSISFFSITKISLQIEATWDLIYCSPFKIGNIQIWF